MLFKDNKREGGNETTGMLHNLLGGVKDRR